jgi:hypothetical protein
MRAEGARVDGARRGFALPLVLAVGACAMLLVLASASTTWRAYRGARHTVAMMRADMAAERGAAEAVTDALQDSLRERPLADPIVTRRVDAEGITLTRTVLRTSPWVLWVSVTASEGGGGDASSVRAVRTRVERLAPPSWPLRSTVVATSPIDSTGALVGGSGASDVTDCLGGPRASVRAAQQLPPDSVRGVWASTWPVALSRGATWTADAPADGRWRVHVIPPRDSVLTGPRTWQGLLLHEGPLRLVGAFSGRGLLVVRGPLNASAARLSVQGAVLVDAPGGEPVRLGAATLQWSRCAVSMALAALAAPRAGPFHTWVGLTP